MHVELLLEDNFKNRVVPVVDIDVLEHPNQAEVDCLLHEVFVESELMESDHLPIVVQVISCKRKLVIIIFLLDGILFDFEQANIVVEALLILSILKV